ncbi:MAG: VirB3 family type IV secretion system protein [Cellvibrionales bacterium]|nr:VirB3 family type IV secretion system protein [Cellvibrionales bacterium]
MDDFKDPLFVSLTRPALKWGIPMDALTAGGLFTLIIFVGTGSFQTFLIYIPLHLGLFLMCKKDPRMIKLLLLWMDTKLQSTGWQHWKAASASPREITCNKRKIPL